MTKKNTYLTVVGIYRQIKTQVKKMLPPETYAGVFYGPTELIYEEKFEFGEKSSFFNKNRTF